MTQQVELDDRVRLGAVFLRQGGEGVARAHLDQDAIDRRNHDLLARGQTIDELRVRPEKRVHREAVLGRQCTECFAVEGGVVNDVAVLLTGRCRGQRRDDQRTTHRPSDAIDGSAERRLGEGRAWPGAAGEGRRGTDRNMEHDPGQGSRHQQHG